MNYLSAATRKALLAPFLLPNFMHFMGASRAHASAARHRPLRVHDIHVIGLAQLAFPVTVRARHGQIFLFQVILHRPPACSIAINASMRYMYFNGGNDVCISSITDGAQ